MTNPTGALFALKESRPFELGPHRAEIAAVVGGCCVTDANSPPAQPFRPAAPEMPNDSPAVVRNSTDPFQLGDDPMSEQELELFGKLNAKTEEIERFVAKAYEIGDIGSLDPTAMQRLEIEVEQLIEQHADALLEGEFSVGMRRARGTTRGSVV